MFVNTGLVDIPIKKCPCHHGESFQKGITCQSYGFYGAMCHVCIFWIVLVFPWITKLYELVFIFTLSICCLYFVLNMATSFKHWYVCTGFTLLSIYTLTHLHNRTWISTVFFSPLLCKWITVYRYKEHGSDHNCNSSHITVFTSEARVFLNSTPQSLLLFHSIHCKVTVRSSSRSLRRYPY